MNTKNSYVERRVNEYSKENDITILQSYLDLTNENINPNIQEIQEVAIAGFDYAIKNKNREFHLQLVRSYTQALNFMGRFQETVEFSQNVISSFTKNDDEKLKFKVYIPYLSALATLGDTRLIFENFDTISANFDESKMDASDVGNLYNIKGSAYLSNGYLNLSFENHIRALNIRKSIKDYQNQVISHININGIYAKLGNKEKAIFHLNSALDTSKNIENINIKIFIYMTYITTHLEFDDYQSIKKWLDLALPLAKEVDHKLIIPSLKKYQALMIAKVGNKEQALKIYKDIEEIILNTNFYTIIFEYYRDFADLYMDLEKFKKAIKNYKIALKKLEGYEEYALLYKTYRKLSQAYESNGQHKKALAYFKKYSNEFNKSLEKNKANAIAEMQIKFETSQKEKESEQFKSESLKFQLQSLRSQMNPHFVFNAISSIGSDMRPDSVEKSKKLLTSFARLMRSNLEFAEQETITLEEEITFLQDYLFLEQSRLGEEKLQFNIEYSVDLALDFIEIPSMLLQPYVENAVKHGIMPLENNGLITISFNETADKLVCIIMDNGVGRITSEKKQKQHKKHLGKSTKITEKRLQLISETDKNLLNVNYTDLKNSKGKPIGTKVALSIKI